MFSSCYFVIRFQTPRDYFEVNAGRVQISSMRDISVSRQGRRTETSLFSKEKLLNFKTLDIKQQNNQLTSKDPSQDNYYFIFAIS